MIDKQDIVSVRSSSFCEEVMVKNKKSFISKYKDFVMDNATLEDILVFSVIK